MQIKIAKAKPYQIDYLIAKIKYPKAQIGVDGWVYVTGSDEFPCPDYCHDWEKAMKLAKEKGLLIDCACSSEGNYRVIHKAVDNTEFTSVGKNLIRTILRCYIMAELKSETAEIEVAV